ncbi:hypothetical protein SBBP2_1140008 [Burkholderiales bacterium]|nr:hypothetical protein SBBP2_1140008 [Burkholderiales bacterium]
MPRCAPPADCVSGPDPGNVLPQGSRIINGRPDLLQLCQTAVFRRQTGLLTFQAVAGVASTTLPPQVVAIAPLFMIAVIASTPFTATNGNDDARGQGG